MSYDMHMSIQQLLYENHPHDVLDARPSRTSIHHVILKPVQA
jgi:hypothetical protein